MSKKRICNTMIILGIVLSLAGCKVHNDPAAINTLPVSLEGEEQSSEDQDVSSQSEVSSLPVETESTTDNEKIIQTKERTDEAGTMEATEEATTGETETDRNEEQTSDAEEQLTTESAEPVELTSTEPVSVFEPTVPPEVETVTEPQTSEPVSIPPSPTAPDPVISETPQAPEPATPEPTSTQIPTTVPEITTESELTTILEPTAVTQPTTVPEPTTDPADNENHGIPYSGYLDARSGINLINTYRKAADADPVEWSDALYAAALIRAQRMYENRSIGHTGDMGGEIHALATSSSQAVDAWADSPGHYAYMIDPENKYCAIAFYDNYCLAMFSKYPLLFTDEYLDLVIPEQENLFDGYMSLGQYEKLMIPKEYGMMRAVCDYTLCGVRTDANGNYIGYVWEDVGTPIPISEEELQEIINRYL